MIKIIQNWDGINRGLMMYTTYIMCEEICYYWKVDCDVM